MRWKHTNTNSAQRPPETTGDDNTLLNSTFAYDRLGPLLKRIDFGLSAKFTVKEQVPSLPATQIPAHTSASSPVGILHIWVLLTNAPLPPLNRILHATTRLCTAARDAVLLNVNGSRCC